MANDDPTPVADDTDDESLLAEIRERYDYASDKWGPILTEGGTDMRYIAGDTWDEDDKKLWVGRPMLSFDQLGQYLNQLVNAIMQQKRAVKVSPEGDGANDKTAQLRADRIRQWEYLSNAQEAYITAFTGASERSYGYVRIVSEREGPRSFNKAPRVRSIPNPDQVLPDPDDPSTCGRGWKYLFYKFPMLRSEFKRDFPDAKSGDFSRDLMFGVNTAWGDERNVLLCEYWKLETVAKKLFMIGTPQQHVNVFEDEVEDTMATLPPGSKVLDETVSDVPEVCQYLTNGVELLAKKGRPKKTPWPGPFIPFAACYGKILWMSQQGINKKIIQSYVRNGRSGQKYYNWLASKEATLVARQANTPTRAYRGQYSPDELAQVALSMHQPVAVITHGALTPETGTAVLPPPDWQPIPMGLGECEVAKETARRDIQAALGRYSASVGKSDTNVRSGVLQENLDRQSDRGSYHFVYHYDNMISFVGEQLSALAEHFDDTAKKISVRNTRDEVEFKSINDPTDPDSISMAQGTHSVTISTGPDFDSERAEASAFADALIQNPNFERVLGPQKSAALIGLAIKLKNIGPLGDAMADIVSPQQQTDPKQAQQKLQELSGQLQHAEQVMQAMHAELEDAKKGNAVKLQIADKDNATKLAIADADRQERAADREVKLAVAELGAKVERMQLFIEERLRVGAQAHDTGTSLMEHAQDLELQAREHAHAAAQTEAAAQAAADTEATA